MENKMYIYETHLHTCEASACGVAHGADYIEFMSKLGYSGIIVTDHFFNGNSCVPSSLPWEEKVNMYCSGYEAAKEASVGSNLSVFFGIEYNFKGDEYLLYGVDKKWLLDNPDIMTKNRTEVYEKVKAYGGMMIQAHPFRERGYLDAIHLTPKACDGIEVYNACNEPYQNALARQYAAENNITVLSGGSDIHHLSDNIKGGVAFDHKLESIHDYIKALLNHEGTPVSLRDGKFIPTTEIEDENITTQKPYLPIIYHEN